MIVSDALKARRSIRGFKKESIAENTLKEILSLAQLAPSNCNSQPWHLTVISGDARDKLENALIDQISKGVQPSPTFQPGDKSFSGIYKTRQHQCAADYYQTMGIEREDKDKRNALMLKNWNFFGAPHVGIVSMPTSMTQVNAIDIGIYLQTLMLLFVEYGISSCPQAALAYYPEPILEVANIPQGNGIICGISFGYEDEDQKINQVKMSRAALEESVNFIY